MRLFPRVALAAAATALAATACSAPSDASAEDPPFTAVTLPDPRGSTAPAPAPTLSTPLPPGRVRLDPGPFDDRVRLDRLALAATATPAVTGHLTITSDVSDVLALELRAAFYDAAGALVATGTFRYQEEGAATGPTGEHPVAAAQGIDFSVPATTAATAASAVLTIPTLVNE